MAEFVIRFDWPEGGPAVYAGWLPDGALGFAPTFETAAVFDSLDIARETLYNGYGPEVRACGSVRNFDREVTRL